MVDKDTDTIIELIEDYGRCLYAAGWLNAMRQASACQTMKDEAGNAYDALIKALGE